MECSTSSHLLEYHLESALSSHLFEMKMGWSLVVFKPPIGAPGSWLCAPWKIDRYPKQAELKEDIFSKPSFVIIFLVSMSHFRGCILSFFGRGVLVFYSTSGWCKFEGFSGQETTSGEAKSVLRPSTASPRIWGVSQLSTKWATTKNSLINRVK